MRSNGYARAIRIVVAIWRELDREARRWWAEEIDRAESNR